MELTEENAPPDPMMLFAKWYEDAQAGAGESDIPNAMALATTSPSGDPSVRFVLLKGYDRRGFLFFTNYESRKGSHLEERPRAAAALFWSRPRRQVRVEGRVETVSAEESDAYFAGRDRESQIGAWASPQSRVISNRQQLEESVKEAEARFSGRDIPRPPYWGGYRIIPDLIEFWSGRDHRLHDRIRYSRQDPGEHWIRERLAP